MNIDILTVAATFTALSVAVNWLILWINKINSPRDELEKRMTEAERKIKEHDEQIAKASSRINTLEKEERLIMRALLALLEHGLDGNNVQKMSEAKNDLEKYLLEK